MTVASVIHDPGLAPGGHRKIDWAAQHSPVLNTVRDRYFGARGLDGVRVGMVLPLEAKTAYLATVLAAAGAEVTLAAPASPFVQDDVAAAVAERGVTVYASSVTPMEQAEADFLRVLDQRPQILVDDRAGLITLAHTARREVLPELWGGSEQTTSGVVRLAAMAASGQLEVPVLAANDARCKYLFDNRYGSGQSVVTALMQSTNLMVAGKRFVILGYGWVGKGIARYAAGLGARVTVCEVDPVKGLEAYADGFDVLPSLRAAEVGEVFVTATGGRDTLTQQHFQRMRDGAVLANAGAWDLKLDLAGLAASAAGVRAVRQHVEEYAFSDGRRVYLVGRGVVVNLSAGDGHPIEIMDLAFAIQALSVHHLTQHHEHMTPTVHVLPRHIDDDVARVKLEAVGMGVDTLSPEQEQFLTSWNYG